MPEAQRLPTVSLVISNRNGKNLLRDCLTSLFHQDYPGECEIIVVDAGSTDGTPAMIEQEFPGVKLVKEERIGIGEAFNMGFRIARGDVLGFDINNDEILSLNWLRILVNALLNDLNAGVVGGMRVLYGTEDTVDEAGITLNYFGIPSSYIHVSLTNVPECPRKVDYVGTPLFRKEMLDIVGLCDESYYLYSEDEDFCARVKKAGYEVLLIPQAIAYHKRSATIGTAHPLSVYYERRNHIRFILKNFPLPRMFFALSWYTLLLTVIEALAFVPFFKHLFSLRNSRLSFLAQRASKANFRAVLAAIFWNVRNFRSTIFERQNISNVKTRARAFSRF